MKYLTYSLIVILGILAIIGWQQAGQVRSEAQNIIENQRAYFQRELTRRDIAYNELYANYLAVGDALNQTAAKALEYQTQYEELQKQGTVIYKYPNTPPYTVFSGPIDFDQALLLLYGMRESHVSALNWTFTTSPGFGIDDREFQTTVIRWYDQLIDFLWRQEKESLD